jgi:hypothetical protein
LGVWITTLKIRLSLLKEKENATIMKKIASLFILLGNFNNNKCAGLTKKVETANLMRSNGRIYVVVAVMVTILIGLVLYIVRLDRKIGKLEKDIRQSGNGQ